MRKSLFIGLVAILGLIGCSRNQEIDIPDADLSLFARTESPADTKTVVEEGVHVYWEPGDEIAVFMGEKMAKFSTDITAASGTATFKGTFGDSEWPEEPDLWAVYPYSEDVTFDGETISTTLPSTQVAREGSFGKDMNLAIAHSNTSTLQFYNVGGGIRFSLADDGITEVILEGLKGETLAGKVKVGFQDGIPAIQGVTERKTSITLTSAAGGTFQMNTWYFFVIIPGALENGFKLTFCKDGTQNSQIFDEAVAIKRGVFGTLTHADKGSGTPTPVPEAIDLGLPSGLKWASFNLGTSSPEGYGDYYAWGETEPFYSSPDPLTWKEGKENGYIWSSYKWCGGSYSTLTKYCYDSSYGYDGFTDTKTVLDPEDDAAHVKLSDKWRMPTETEWTELMENCTWTWTEKDGVNGYLVSGTNDNSLFLPAAGYRYSTNLGDVGSFSDYWSSSLSTDYPYSAWYVHFLSGYVFRSDLSLRCDGRSVRPVYGDPPIPVESISLDITEIEIGVGESIQLTATILPENATYKKPFWSSSDDSIVRVSSSGVVTGWAEGIATITASFNTAAGRPIDACEVIVKRRTPSVPVPEAVDLGLSVKWASFNLGASKPEEWGDYYAWGETEPYYSSIESSVDPLAWKATWKTGKEAGYDWASYKWALGSYTTLTRYCPSDMTSHWGGFGGLDIPGLNLPDGVIEFKDYNYADDAARQALGGKWRTPTEAEWRELIDNCTWTKITETDGNGFLVTSNKEGFTDKSIFLPAAGRWYQTDFHYYTGIYGWYWSSSIRKILPHTAFTFIFTAAPASSSQYVAMNSSARSTGLSVRPVCD